MERDATTTDPPVIVPAHLARRIRLALDHAHRVTVGGVGDRREVPDSYQQLADELVGCEDYPLWKEPWSDA